MRLQAANKLVGLHPLDADAHQPIVPSYGEAAGLELELMSAVICSCPMRTCSSWSNHRLQREQAASVQPMGAPWPSQNCAKSANRSGNGIPVSSLQISYLGAWWLA